MKEAIEQKLRPILGLPIWGIENMPGLMIVDAGAELTTCAGQCRADRDREQQDAEVHEPRVREGVAKM